jgi:dihydroorotase
MPGVQTMLPCLLSFVATKRITLEKIVRMLCERPAELYGVKGKGKIAESYDADLVLLKPDRSFEVERSWLATKSGWSPFEGMSLFGRPEHVYVHGVPVVTGGELTGKRPARAAEFDWK